MKQHGSELSGLVQRIEAHAHSFNICGSGGAFVSKFLPEFGGEQEARVAGNTGEPLCGQLWTDGLVEGGIDFDGVEKFGEVVCFVKTARTRRGIDDAVPICIGPARGTDVNFSLRW